MKRMSESTKYEFKAEIKKLLHILSQSLYKHKEIFLRELISNSSDALKKMHFISLSNKDIANPELELKIELTFNAKEKTLIVSDTGLGMTKQELIDGLGTIAASGTSKFLENLKSTQKEGKDKETNGKELTKELDDIIGQFGVGFYSVFMVTDKVKVVTKSYKKDEPAYVWESEGTGEFTITETTRATRGTDIIITLRDDESEYLSQYRLENIIKKYSNYVPYPIFVIEIKEPEKKDEKKEGEEKKDEKKEGEEKKDEKKEPPAPPKPVNDIIPLWKKDAADIKPEDYKNFYNVIAHRYDNYSHVVYYKVDGQVQFRSIFFIPETKSRDLMQPEVEYGLSLYSKNVLIMENCKDLIPQWMRFIKGMVDSEDIPLNVSRDTIQNNRVIMKINQLIVKKLLDELGTIIEKEPDKYKKIWKEFSFFLKEGVVTDHSNQERLLKYLRFYTSKTPGEDQIGLDTYVKNIKPDQTEIYYLVGENLNTLRISPHLGFYNSKGFEVLLLNEPIDNFLMMNLRDYKVKEGDDKDAKEKVFTFVPIDTTEKSEKKDKDEKKDKKEEDKEKEDKEDVPEKVKKFLDHIKTILGDKILEAKSSKKLFGAACRLANPAGGMTSSMQRAMRFWTQTSSGKDFKIPQKIFEVDPSHPIIESLIELFATDPTNGKIKPVITQMFQNCLLVEGDLPDPSLMVPRINQLIEMLMTGKTDVVNPGEEWEKQQQTEEKPIPDIEEPETEGNKVDAADAPKDAEIISESSPEAPKDAENPTEESKATKKKTKSTKKTAKVVDMEDDAPTSTSKTEEKK